MKKTYCIIICVFILISCNSSHKFFNKIKIDKPFTATGYVMNLYGKFGVWIFQPCNDSNTNVLNAMNGKSFFVQDVENDIFQTSLIDSKGIGRKVPVMFYDSFLGKNIIDTLEYLYCNVTINPIEKYKTLDTCSYIMKNNSGNRKLACISLTSYVSSLQPMNVTERNKYLEILIEKNRSLPEWSK